MTAPAPPSYAGHRFPAEVISHAVWLYFRFPLSLRMIEEMLAAGLDTGRLGAAGRDQLVDHVQRHRSRIEPMLPGVAPEPFQPGRTAKALHHAGPRLLTGTAEHPKGQARRASGTVLKE